MVSYKATISELESLLALRAARDKRGVVSLLTAWAEQYTSSLSKADDPMLVYRLQGRLAVIRDLLDTIDNAPNLLESARRKGG